MTSKGPRRRLTTEFKEARAALIECIAVFCNRRRWRSNIGYRTPEQARIDMTRAMAAW